MNLNTVEKYVINLDNRPERLEQVTDQFNKLGWEYKRFSGINTGDFKGCLCSHLELVKLAHTQNLENILVAEDDVIFTPWTVSLIEELTPILSTLKFGVLNLNLSIHRPVNISSESKYLLDLTNLPPKEAHHRGLYSTALIIYNKSVYDDILKINKDGSCEFDPGDSPRAIDEHLTNYIYPKHQSYSPIVPFSTQRRNWSDVSSVESNNHYMQTYNWNLYTPVKLNSHWFREESMLAELTNIDFKTVYE